MPLSAYAIRTRRELLGYSQRDLAKLSGVKQPLLSAIETGKRQPTLAVSAAVEEHLRIRPSSALAAKKQQVKDLIAVHRGKAGYVFGSAACGTDHLDSDLDIMVEFEPDADITDLLGLEEELRTVLTVPVDVISAGSSSRFMKAIREQAIPL
ncbi:MAG: helix-turn-helix domain-containing protein [Propionibacteriaceae bacterium]|nr:helix-turn-helix domain-containing protein [Propionibacteriaceae bacterium]